MNDAARLALPVVAVVGRPNVGKSSLVNRVLGQREAIVEATPGVTRDRRAFVATWGSRSFEIVDTGGLEAGQQGLEALVGEQAEVAIAGADVIMLVVDAAAGPIEDELVLARRLRASDKPVLVAANKVDDGRDEASVASFYRLGLGDPIPVSALHGRGSGDLLDALVDLLPESMGSGSSAWASIAIVGRPNVGKSSLLNALLGEPRSIVDHTPGTTRDPVDAELILPGDRTLKIIDTAGMRKRVRIEDPLEYFSWIRSRRVLERADAIVFVVDAADGATGLDQRLLEAIIESGRACVIALNKWDLIDLDGPDRDRFERDLNERLRFLPWATVLRVSALTGRGVVGIPGMVDRAISSHRRRLTTSHVNRIVADAQAERPHPRTRGRSIRVRYAVQAEVAPPTFVLFSSGALEVSYLRYLEGRIRRVEAFDGSPVRLQYRVKTRGEH